MMEAQVGVEPLLGGGHEPRTVGSLWRLERERHGCCLGASRRNTVLSTA